MPKLLENPHRGKEMGLGPVPRSDATGVAKLLEHCPAHRETPLVSLDGFAGVGTLIVKDERGRMGLGSFKALGAAHAIAKAAKIARSDDLSQALSGRVFVTASAGNHGMSVAAGARVFGARAVIYLAETVPQAFADRLAEKGADVVRAGEDYEASMAAAAAAAEAHGWTLLSDSSWETYIDLPMDVMEGYLQMAAEVVAQMPRPPSHILLQAGVGGLAASVAAHLRQEWGDGPQIIVVEPEAAPALIETARAGRLVDTTGPVSSMGRLDCKTASIIAAEGLLRDADTFVTISEAEAAAAVTLLAQKGIETTPSGVAGIAAVLAGLPGIGTDATVLCFVTEGPADG